jgi:hypothetical protein
MLRISLFFLAMVASLKFSGQEISIQLSASDSAIIKGDYQLAINLLRQVITDSKDEFELEGAKYNICCAYSFAGKIDSSFYCLDKYLSSKNRTDIFYDSDFFALIHDQRWRLLFKKLTKSYFVDHPTYDKEMVYQLSLINICDQALYKNIDAAEARWGRNCVAASAMWKTKDSMNTKNLDKLNEMCPEGLFPKSSLIGREGLQTLFLVIQHSTIEVQEKYLPVIEKLTHENEIRTDDFVLLKDRVLVREGKPQLYGSQVKTDSTGLSYPFPIVDEPHVNVRRKELGLTPLEDYLQHFNIVYHLPK